VDCLLFCGGLGDSPDGMLRIVWHAFPAKNILLLAPGYFIEVVR
jgi:hypothetical protein